MSSNSYFCAFANGFVNDGYISNRSIVNPNIIFSWVWTASSLWIVAFDLYGESVRFILCRSVISQNSVVTIQVGNHITWFIPNVVQITNRICECINISNQADSVGVAYMLITKDSNSRVTEYCQLCWVNQFWVASQTFRSLVSDYAVNVSLSCTISGHRLIVDSSGVTF